MIFSPLEPRSPSGGESGDGDSPRLYSPRHVALASLIGGPFGGAALIGFNFQRRRRLAWAVTTFALAGVGMVATAVLAAWFLPPGYDFRALTFLAFLFMYFLAHRLQGAAHRAHLRNGGRNALYRRAAGIGILALVATAMTAAVVTQLGLVLAGLAFELGRHDYELGHYDGAVKRFSFSIRLEPDDPYSYWYRGDSLLELERFEEAERDLSVYVREVPEDVDGWSYRGYARIERGNDRGAIDDYTKAIAIDATCPWFYTQRGMARFKLEDHHAAIADLDRALTLDSEDGETYFVRGRSHLSIDDHAAAVDDFTSSIRLGYALAPSYYNRGLARRWKGDLEGALADFALARSSDPEDEDAPARWSEVLAEIRARDEPPAK